MQNSNQHNLLHFLQNNTLLQCNIPLKNKNWFKTGGLARYYSEPINAQEFQIVLQFAQEHNLEIFVLGEGANILISDEGFDGLVIRPTLTTITQNVINDSVLVTSGSGVGIQDLITWCLDNNIGGLEEFSGIPGTIGGATYINLHYYDFLLDHFILEATVIEKATGAILTVDRNWFEFGYNQSKLLEKKYYVIDITFTLKKLTDLETAYAQGRRAEIIRHRQRRYPVQNTCGSFFRNFKPEEIEFEENGKKIIFVAYYLDKVGVRGQFSCGGASVSHLHANMIVNEGNATSNDIVQLARIMQEKVHQKFGIIPQLECQLVGFKKYPLL